MAVNMREGNLPHIWWIDLKNDGVFVECAVMSKDNLGNVMYFALNNIDDIDKRRLFRIVSNRNAKHFELYDLMSTLTLNNGVNALVYFHQLVHVMTPSGRQMRPQHGVIGIGEGGRIDTRGKDKRAQMEADINSAAGAAATAAATAAVRAIQQYNTEQSATPVPKGKK